MNFVLFIGVIIMICVYSVRIYSLRKQNMELKKKLSDLALKAGDAAYNIYNINKEDKAKLLNLKISGEKIQAVKLLKENYHMSLAEAKNYVDLL